MVYGVMQSNRTNTRTLTHTVGQSYMPDGAAEHSQCFICSCT